jgi:uroporphyrinogen-III synthase
VLSVQRLSALAANDAVMAALDAAVRLYTSPAAVRFALAQAGDLRQPGVDVAVGSGTAAALRAAGVESPLHPARMDSEGLLDLPALSDGAGTSLGVITAPGGRGLLVPALRERGFQLRLAEVYARRSLHGGARQRAAFTRDPAAVLLVSSREAFDALLSRLPKHQWPTPRALVASSARLAEYAAGAGFSHCFVAASPRPNELIAAAFAAASYNADAAHGRAAE